MTIKTIVSILMERDGIPLDQAEELLREAQCEVENGADPEEILMDYFGLEPDFIFELIPLPFQIGTSETNGEQS